VRAPIVVRPEPHVSVIVRFLFVIPAKSVARPLWFPRKKNRGALRQLLISRERHEDTEAKQASAR
jgi:hypothetical protein